MWKAGVTVVIVYGMISIGVIDTLAIIYNITIVNFCGWAGDIGLKRGHRRWRWRCRWRQIFFVLYFRHCWFCAGAGLSGCPLPWGLAPAFSLIAPWESIIRSFSVIWWAFAVSCRRLNTVSYRFFRKDPDISFARVIKRALFFQKCLQQAVRGWILYSMGGNTHSIHR